MRLLIMPHQPVELNLCLNPFRQQEANSRAYQELDIDKLLETTARVVKVDNNEGGEEQADYASVFSKASFIPSDQQGGGKDQGRVDGEYLSTVHAFCMTVVHSLG
jgi:hypothetical protein